MRVIIIDADIRNAIKAAEILQREMPGIQIDGMTSNQPRQTTVINDQPAIRVMQYSARCYRVDFNGRCQKKSTERRRGVK